MTGIPMQDDTKVLDPLMAYVEGRISGGQHFEVEGSILLTFLVDIDIVFFVVFFCSLDWLLAWLIAWLVDWLIVLWSDFIHLFAGGLCFCKKLIPWEDSCDYKHGSSHLMSTYILLLYSSRSTLKRMQTWCLFGQDISSTSRTVPPSDFNLLHCGLCVPWNSGPLRKFGGMGDNMYHAHETIPHLRS